MAIFFLSKDSRICCSSFWGRSTGWAWAEPSWAASSSSSTRGGCTGVPLSTRPQAVPGAHLRLLHEGLLAPAQLPPQQLQRGPVLQGLGASLLVGLRESLGQPQGCGRPLWSGTLGSGVQGAVRGVAGSALTVAQVLPDPCRCRVLTQVRAVQLECSGHRGRNCCPGPRRAPSCSRRSWFCLFWGVEGRQRDGAARHSYFLGRRRRQLGWGRGFRAWGLGGLGTAGSSWHRQVPRLGQPPAWLGRLTHQLLILLLQL